MKKIISLSVMLISLFCLFTLTSCGQDAKTLKSIEVNGKTIACDMDMKKVLLDFSDLEYEYSESISCAYNGMDKIYDFADAGFVVYTYPDGDKDFVLEVAVSSEGIKQLKDKVYVGMPLSELESLFGTDYQKEGDTVTYKVEGKQTMYYLLDDDKVIEYAISVAE